MSFIVTFLWMNPGRAEPAYAGRIPYKGIRPLGDERFCLALFLSVPLCKEYLFVEYSASMPCRSDGPGFCFLVINNPDMSLEARRAVQREPMRCRFVHGVF
jgi:hypothetical protein